MLSPFAALLATRRRIHGYVAGLNFCGCFFGLVNFGKNDRKLERGLRALRQVRLCGFNRWHTWNLTCTLTSQRRWIVWFFLFYFLAGIFLCLGCCEQPMLPDSEGASKIGLRALDLVDVGTCHCLTVAWTNLTGGDELI